MKRMNLIRAALFAVFAFMGTVSLSAQSWLPPEQAVVVIANELNQLNEPPTPPAAGAGLTPKQAIMEQNGKIGCTDCFLKACKRQFLSQTLVKIKEGADTGTAVNEVRAFLIANSANNATILATVQQAYEYMQAIL